MLPIRHFLIWYLSHLLTVASLLLASCCLLIALLCLLSSLIYLPIHYSFLFLSQFLSLLPYYLLLPFSLRDVPRSLYQSLRHSFLVPVPLYSFCLYSFVHSTSCCSSGASLPLSCLLLFLNWLCLVIDFAFSCCSPCPIKLCFHYCIWTCSLSSVALYSSLLFIFCYFSSFQILFLLLSRQFICYLCCFYAVSTFFHYPLTLFLSSYCPIFLLSSHTPCLPFQLMLQLSSLLFTFLSRRSTDSWYSLTDFLLLAIPFHRCY